MNKSHQKKAFSFYRSYYETLNMLNDSQYVAFNKALTSVMFFDQHIDDVTFSDPLLRVLWASMKHSLKQSIDGFLSKNKIQYEQALSTPSQGGSQGGSIHPSQQEEGEEQVKEKGEEQEQHTVKPQAVVTTVDDVFSYWQQVMNHRRSKLDANRKKLITNALKIGYDVEQLKTAIDGCAKTPHNMGQNDRGQVYDGLHIIFKNADNIDRFIRNADTCLTRNGTLNNAKSAAQMAAENFRERCVAESLQIQNNETKGLL